MLGGLAVRAWFAFVRGVTARLHRDYSDGHVYTVALTMPLPDGGRVTATVRGRDLWTVLRGADMLAATPTPPHIHAAIGDMIYSVVRARLRYPDAHIVCERG